jgi:hypothetical protein
MRKILIAAVLAVMAGGASAADFSDLKSFTADTDKTAVPAVSVTKDVAVVRSEGVTAGVIRFIDWSKMMPGNTSGLLTISGAAAKTMYDTMLSAKYRPEPANMAQLKPSQVTRGMCEARISKQMTCLKIPLFSADNQSLVLSGGKPVYNDTSYQCDISVSDVRNMDFN